MVEVMVAFAQCQKCRDKMIAGCMAVIKSGVTEPMGKAIDAKGCVVNRYKPGNCTEAESTLVDDDKRNKQYKPNSTGRS